VKPLLLRIWRDVPFPDWLRLVFLRVLNPAFMVGAMALIQDEAGRILLLQHTYRPDIPWGLPGGWLKHAESPEAGLAREVMEETGFQIEVEQLIAAAFHGRWQMDLMFRCRILSGTYHPTDETVDYRWTDPMQLPVLLPNQLALLRKAGLTIAAVP
jgi:8-oxo-dGTP pyrophosphatase MutT (NUDIX family)